MEKRFGIPLISILLIVLIYFAFGSYKYKSYIESEVNENIDRIHGHVKHIVDHKLLIQVQKSVINKTDNINLESDFVAIYDNYDQLMKKRNILNYQVKEDNSFFKITAETTQLLGQIRTGHLIEVENHETYLIELHDLMAAISQIKIENPDISYSSYLKKLYQAINDNNLIEINL